MFNWFNNLFSNKNSINNRSKTTTPNNSNSSNTPNNIKSLEDATMAYILSKYKKESYKIMREHILSTNIEGLNQDRMDELKKFLESILLVVEDDFFKGYRLLKGRMVKIDQYVFSQYKKDPLLKNNIYKVLYFASNRRFSNNVKENLTAYFALIEELGFEVILFLEDYHKTMEELEKNPRASIHLKKNYGLQNFVKKNFEDSIDSINEQSIQFLTTDSIATQTKYITPFINNDNEVNNNNNNNNNTNTNTNNNNNTSSYIGAHSSSSHSLEEKIENQLKELNNNKNHNNDYSNDSVINLDLDAPTK